MDLVITKIKIIGGENMDRKRFIQLLQIENMAELDYIFKYNDSIKIAKKFLMDSLFVNDEDKFDLIYKIVSEMFPNFSFSKSENEFYTDFFNRILRLNRLPKQEYEIYKKKIQSVTDKINKLMNDIDSKILSLKESFKEIKKEIKNINKDILKAKKDYLDFSELLKTKEKLVTEERLKVQIEIDKCIYFKELLQKEKERVLKTFTEKNIRIEALRNCREPQMMEIPDHRYEVSLVEKSEELFKPECDYSVNIKFYMETMKIIEKIKNQRDLDEEKIKKIISQNKYDTRKIEIIKKTSLDEYKTLLKAYIKERNIVEYILENTRSNHIIHHRYSIIENALKYFKNSDYLSFINLIVIQIEGIFYDYCVELDMLPNDIKTFTLGTKLKQLEIAIEFNPYPYFKYQFEFLRNKIAHGHLIDKETVELSACEILLDLLYLVFDLNTNKKLPYFEPLEFLKIYRDKTKKHIRVRYFGTSHENECLWDYLHCSEYSKRIQWLLNPTYNKVYEFYKLDEVVIDVRRHLNTIDFWQFVQDRISNKNQTFINEKEIKRWNSITQLMINFYKNKKEYLDVFKKVIELRGYLKKLLNQNTKS